jgi:uncharacterized protein YggT (Ycf19 family)
MIYILHDLVGRLVITMLQAMQFLMFGRALISWFSPDEDSRVAKFLYMSTEPLVYPIRQIMNRFDFFSGIPIDMSFMVAMIVLIMCTTFLNMSFM